MTYGALFLASAMLIGAEGRAATPTHQIEVDVRDLDLRSDNGKVTRDYRVGASAAAACNRGASQRRAEFHACVDFAVAGARRTCRSERQSCPVSIDPHARPVPPGLSLGSRSNN